MSLVLVGHSQRRKVLQRDGAGWTSRIRWARLGRRPDGSQKSGESLTLASIVKLIFRPKDVFRWYQMLGVAVIARYNELALCGEVPCVERRAGGEVVHAITSSNPRQTVGWREDSVFARPSLSSMRSCTNKRGVDKFDCDNAGFGCRVASGWVVDWVMTAAPELQGTRGAWWPGIRARRIEQRWIDGKVYLV